MSSNWKYAIGLITRAAIVGAIIFPIAYFFSIRPVILLLAIASLIGLWVKRKELPSIIKRAGVIISVVLVTALFFGFLLWFIGDTESSIGLILTTAVVIVMTVGLYGGEIPTAQQAKTSALADDELLSAEKQRACPVCGAMISQDAMSCSWCGKSI